MAESPKPNPLGRSALLVQGLGLLSVGIVAAAMTWIGMEGGEGNAIVAVASAAAGVFFFWSLVLAIRAITGGERSRWPMAILLLILLEIGLPCLGLWSEVLEDHHNAALNFMIWLGLPVFGPFVALASLLAAPLALWRARKTEAAESAAGVKSWRRKTWKVWLAWYSGIMALLGIFLLPGPLFLLGATASQFDAAEDVNGEPESASWGRFVATHSPDFVRDNVGRTLDLFPSSAAAEDFLARIDEMGLASRQRLIDRLAPAGQPKGAPMFNPAWSGLHKSYPEAIPEVVNGVIGGQIDVSGECTKLEILKWLGRRADTPHLRQFLTRPIDKFKYSRVIVLSELQDNGHIQELVPDLEALIVSNSLDTNELDCCIDLLAQNVKPEDAARMWQLFTSFEPRRRNAAAAAANLPVCRSIVEPLLICFAHTDLETRRAAAIALMFKRDSLRPHLFRKANNLAERRLTEALLAILDDRDLRMRLAAMCVLGDIFREGVGNEARASAEEQIQKSSYWNHTGSEPTDVPAEREELANVKAAVGKWLKENVPEK